MPLLFIRNSNAICPEFKRALLFHSLLLRFKINIAPRVGRRLLILITCFRRFLIIFDQQHFPFLQAKK